MTENGYGKRTRVTDYPVKGRGGMGVKTVQLTEAKGQLAGARVVRDGYQVMLISTGGTVIRMPVEDVKRLGSLDAGRDRDAAPRRTSRSRRSLRSSTPTSRREASTASRPRRSPTAARRSEFWDIAQNHFQMARTLAILQERGHA